MIDIENVKKVFDEYVSNFNPNDGKIKLKIDHIKRVADVSKMLAVNLNLNEEQILLAEIIGFFHDLGRFKQVELYNTFNDRISANHAELSVNVLFEDNLIEKFKIDESYFNIIKIAILNHNKNKIDEGLNDEELLFSKIIRDADKLDIFYTICHYDFESFLFYHDFKCCKINDAIMQQFFNYSLIDYNNLKCSADQLITFYAFIYDFNFKFSLEYLKSKKYFELFADRIREKFGNGELIKQIDEIVKFANKYLNLKTEKI